MPKYSSYFETTHQSRNGRLGSLVVQQDSHTFKVKTPALLPVVCFMTGTTARGGGIWKYVLQADETNGLLRRDIPVISQVLHFLDFSSANKPHVLETWRSQSLRGRYNSEVEPALDYSAPIFLDSGGFKLLWNTNLDLSDFGLSIKDGDGPRTILNLQQDLGGDIVASLDYPLPPGLSRTEALERMKKSRDNATRAALLIQELKTDERPFLFVAAHGQDEATIGRYVRLVFEEFENNGLEDFPFGMAIGSLVPLRGAHKYQIITELLQGVVDNIPPEIHDTTPIHVFGITGNLIPILAYLGIDSFDSSTYIQEARSLKYMDPTTRKSRPILEMEHWECECRVCRRVALKEIQDALTSNIRYKPLPNGHYKSKYYGDIALHNLELDFSILEATQSAIEADELQEYLVEHLDEFPELQSSLDVIAKKDESLKTRLAHSVHPVRKIESPESGDEPTISLQYTPDDFNILINDYPGPPKPAGILLIIPCSKGKPYSESRTHQFVDRTLREEIGERVEGMVHKVILSGLYGPVPEECENEEPVKHYDFQLKHYNRDQIALVTDRVQGFLDRYADEYRLCLAYATSRAYREVLERVAEHDNRLIILPQKPKSRRLTEFFRRKNINELVRAIVKALGPDGDNNVD